MRARAGRPYPVTHICNSDGTITSDTCAPVGPLRCYAARYPDLLRVYCKGNLERCIWTGLAGHWVIHGMREGRILECSAPPPPSPAPPPPPAYFTVDGPCTVDGACARSPNYPSNYGDRQSCTITPTSLAVGQLLSATAFDTESCCDKLIVNGATYSGTIGPSNVLLGSASFTWSSDHNVQGAGWEVCALAPPATIVKVSASYPQNQRVSSYCPAGKSYVRHACGTNAEASLSSSTSAQYGPFSTNDVLQSAYEVHNHCYCCCDCHAVWVECQ